ncbi:MAG: N-acetylmuramoyl-L-alanine amidase [Elusimicrobia bacterium]|nr:N-acetylmuramoyl-L-alanine amidase [Elusimicrobiota bacterium]
MKPPPDASQARPRRGRGLVTWLVAGAALLLRAAAAAGTVEVVVDGRYKGTATDYRVGPTTYLGATDVGGIYGAQVYWYPVSGRLRLSLRGRPLELMVGSETAVVNGKKVGLGAQVILRGSEAFVPISLLKTREFVAWAGMRAEFNEGSQVLSVDGATSPSAPRPASALPEGSGPPPAGSARDVRPSTAPARAGAPGTAGAENALPAEAGVSSRPVAGAGKFRVVVDPGHGGKDSGAVGKKGTLEKDVVLSVGLALAAKLEEGGAEVLLTRSDDYFVPLSERSRAANEFGADLFVSIHCNSSPKKRDTGFELYFLSEKASDPEAERIANLENSVLELEGKSVEEEQAEIILRAMTKTEYMNEGAQFAAVLARRMEKKLDLTNRGVKQAGFYVLRGTDAPAVLFEIAFLSYRKDEARLGSKSFRKRVVEGLYQGIMEYGKEKGRMAR